MNPDSDNSLPDPTIQTLIDGSQITVDPTRYEIAQPREDADPDLESQEFGTDGNEIDVQPLTQEPQDRRDEQRKSQEESRPHLQPESLVP